MWNPRKLPKRERIFIVETPVTLQTRPLNQLNRAERHNISGAELDVMVQELFTYREWTEEQKASGKRVKDFLAEAYKAIIINVPSCPARTRALNALTDARMLANQAISFNGEV
jgi:acyl carrier protein phosphodiesterase